MTLPDQIHVHSQLSTFVDLSFFIQICYEKTHSELRGSGGGNRRRLRQYIGRYSKPVEVSLENEERRTDSLRETKTKVYGYPCINMSLNTFDFNVSLIKVDSVTIGYPLPTTAYLRGKTDTGLPSRFRGQNSGDSFRHVLVCG